MQLQLAATACVCVHADLHAKPPLALMQHVLPASMHHGCLGLFSCHAQLEVKLSVIAWLPPACVRQSSRFCQMRCLMQCRHAPALAH